MERRVQKLLARFSEVEELLGQPEVLGDQKKYRALTQEHSYLNSLKSLWDRKQKLVQELENNRALACTEEDPDFVAVLNEDTLKIEKTLEGLQAKLEALLVPPDPRDSRNSILEIRAGTGGDEAALFVGDCVRMYKMYADRQGWRYEELTCTPSELGGYKEYVMALSGHQRLPLAPP